MIMTSGKERFSDWNEETLEFIPPEPPKGPKPANPLMSLPKQEIDPDMLLAIEGASSTQAPETIPEDLDVAVTGEQLNRLLVDGVYGVPTPDSTPAMQEVRKRLAEDLARIEEVGGTVEVPPEIVGE
jgi:hypothetical protein